MSTSNLEDFIGSIGSFDTTMANAMLDSEFKSSHPDLTIWKEENSEHSKMNSERRFGNRESIDETLPTNTDNRGSGGETKKSDMRSVVIQLPPKRRKLDPSITAKRIVHGMFAESNANNEF
mgnify:CR=1 FL=1